MRFFWFLAISFLLLSCKAVDKSHKVTAIPKDMRHEKQEDNPQIAFLYFEIVNKGGNNLEIRLVDTQLSKGRMKENTVRQAPNVNGNLLVHLLDETDQVQIEQMVVNPLAKTIEQYSEDGEIISNYIELEEAQFFIRFNYKDTIKTLKIYSIQSGQPVEVYHNPIQL